MLFNQTLSRSNLWSDEVSPKPAPSNPWLPCGLGPQAVVRLFCFPYSGAGATVFYPWLNVLPANVQVCPVELPGRGTRLSEACYTRLPALVEAAAQALLPCLDRPFVLFGHSMGALVSFELARTLKRCYGLAPIHLFVSGHNAPQQPTSYPLIHALPDAEFVEQIRSLNGTAEQLLVNQELMQLLLPVLRADFALCETYEYHDGPPLDCPISAFGGLGDAYVDREGLEAWGEQTSGHCSARLFPGDHFYMNTARLPLLRAIALDLIPSVSNVRTGPTDGIGRM